jgi:pimeloyl-ACP methyl ester carboxylesterase
LGSQSLTPQAHSFEDHWITLDGARMRYLRDGTGRPLLLLHGLLGYSFSWRYVIPALAPYADVHAVDMLGVGFSDRPRGLNCCLHASAERLIRFLDAVGIPSCDLVGTSHGGAVAMMAASLAPDRINRLVLVAPANPWSHLGRRTAALLTIPPVNWVFPLVAPLLQMIHGRLLRGLYGDPSRIRPGTLEGYSAPLAQPGAFQTGMSILRTWAPDLEELRGALPRISHIPTLIIWGSMDNAVDPASAEELCRQFQNGRLLMLPGIGHLPYEEAPEEFNEAVLEFLLANPVD